MIVISILGFGHLLEDLILGYSLATKPGEYTEVSFWLLLGILQSISYVIFKFYSLNLVNLWFSYLFLHSWTKRRKTRSK